VRRVALLTLMATTVAACATLDQFRGLIQAPTFTQSDQHEPQLRMVGPSTDLPLGGVAVRLWTKVSNPNPFGLTLRTLEGTLVLEDFRGMTAEFPLGLPLGAGQQSEVPLDLTMSFSSLPELARVIQNASRTRRVPYRFEGTIGVDAGRLGQPVFGPMTLFNGELSTP
jgi:hypothetical protein